MFYTLCFQAFQLDSLIRSNYAVFSLRLEFFQKFQHFYVQIQIVLFLSLKRIYLGINKLER